MSEKTESVKGLALRTNAVVAVLSIIALATALGSTVKAQLLLASIMICIILTVIITAIRVTATDNLALRGKAIIQGAWFYMSLSISYIIMPGSPYFEMSISSAVINALIGIVTLIVGAYSLLKTRKETGVMISI